MTRTLRAAACVIVAIMTVACMIVYHRYTGAAPNTGVAATVSTVAALVTWLVTELN
jgi:hypothetical protein